MRTRKVVGKLIGRIGDGGMESYSLPPCQRFCSSRRRFMTKQLVELITSVERRPRWSREEKERLVAATFEPVASISEIARSASIHVSQLFRWRKELCQISAPPVPQVVPVEIVKVRPAPNLAQPPPVPQPRKKASTVMIKVGGGRRLRFESDIDTEALPACSMCWSGDDPGPERCKGLAGHWLYRNAERLSRSVADGTGTSASVLWPVRSHGHGPKAAVSAASFTADASTAVVRLFF
ncbi:IS66-like element accessory protein TnpA [Ensifer aridi]|uniref:IS66-like element accessory protein TnpA n=1 Tax=Ensifer aridi TaxID=1708715 RepID=UPI000A0F4400|nr:transposase [Ensifer aridi]